MVGEDGVNVGRGVRACGSMRADTNSGRGHRVRVSMRVAMRSGGSKDGRRHAGVRGTIVLVEVGHECKLR